MDQGDGLAIVGLGSGVEVGSQVWNRLAGVVGVHADDSQIAVFLGVVGRQRDQAAEDRQGVHVFLALEVGRLQVAEHPADHDSRRARGQDVLGQGPKLLAGDLGDPSGAALAIQEQALVERVDEQRRIAEPDHEVSRQIHADHRQADPISHRQVQQRQADRNADAAVDHVVEIAVSRVVVVVLVPPEVLLVEQNPVDLAQDRPGLQAVGAAVANPAGQGIDPAEVAVGVELGVGVPGQFERQTAKVHPVVARDQALKLGILVERPGHGSPYPPLMLRSIRCPRPGDAEGKDRHRPGRGQPSRGGRLDSGTIGPGETSPASRDHSNVNGISRGIRAAQLGLIVNGLLVIVKLVAGILGNAYALVADAVESSVDLFSSLVVWSGLQITNRPANDSFPYGYGKAEPMAAMAVALMLLGASVGIATAAVREILTPHHAPAAFTLVVLAVVVAVKELLARRVQRVGREVGSTAVRADAWHHRSDALTSLAAFVGIAVARLGGPGWESADDWAALIAAVIIAVNGVLLLRPAIFDLMDRAPDPDLIARIQETARSVEGVLATEKLRVRKFGVQYFVDLHVQADPLLSLQDSHALSGKVKAAIRSAVPAVWDTSIHMEPFVGAEPQPSA